jgi:hypothetical protein
MRVCIYGRNMSAEIIRKAIESNGTHSSLLLIINRQHKFMHDANNCRNLLVSEINFNSFILINMITFELNHVQAANAAENS